MSRSEFSQCGNISQQTYTIVLAELAPCMRKMFPRALSSSSSYSSFLLLSRSSPSSSSSEKQYSAYTRRLHLTLLIYFVDDWPVGDVGQEQSRFDYCNAQ